MPRPVNSENQPSIHATQRTAEQFLQSPERATFSDFVHAEALDSAKAYAEAGLFPEALESPEQQEMLDLLLEIAYRDAANMYLALRAFLAEHTIAEEAILPAISRSTTLARHLGSFSNADNFATSLALRAYESRKEFFRLGTDANDELVVRFTPDLLAAAAAFTGKQNGCPLMQVKAEGPTGTKVSVYELYWQALVDKAHREFRGFR